MNQTLTLTTKTKIVMAATVTAALLLVAVPFVAYAAPAASKDPVQGTRNLIARGTATENVNGENVATPANLTLTLERTGTNTTIPKFNVISGSVNIDGTTYTITSGNGGVLLGRRAILLQAQGMGPDGQPVALKLAGRYFWMGGHLFVVRMAGSMQTGNGKEVLLMRAAIRI